MATLAGSSPSPPRSLKKKRKTCLRRCERCCWTFLTYFPLVMVYGLTTWAVWVQANAGFSPKKHAYTGMYSPMSLREAGANAKNSGTASALVGIIFYILLNWSYTVAVFTDPGSPLTQTTSAYSILPSDGDDPELEIGAPPMTSGPDHASVTVKSSGEMRYCKKCNTRKPDRTHHCSTCRRCVLKMDHHCPWLATCVGLHNQKAFILFLVYVSLFCWVCFGVSITWVVAEFFGELQYNEALMPVNYILLSVLSGIIGLVITGFTGWHIYLASRGQTTIESLESTRYIVPLRKGMQQPPFTNGHSPEQRQYVDQIDKSEAEEPTFGTQLRNIHANALPGITRPEEGVETPDRSLTPSDLDSSPAHNSLRQHLNSTSYHQNREIDHERARYQAYLDEVDSAKLPHAFNHGWRQNFRQLFGERPELALIPICNSTGDGWNWEPSQEWLEARSELERERAARKREEEAFQRDRMETMPSYRKEGATSSSSDDDDVPLSHRSGNRRPPPPPPWSSSGTPAGPPGPRKASKGPTSNWNDIPSDLLSAARAEGSRSRSPAGRKGRKNG